VGYAMNAWYMAAWSSEVSTSLFARRFLDIPIVLFREEDGTLVALEDRCPHRFAPLHRGRFASGVIECAYHGLRFNAAGACIHNPAGDTIPPQAKVRAFPVHERNHIAWIWMGQADLADPGLIPDFSCIPDEPGECANIGNYLHVRANYLLEIDNLMDLSHVNYLHHGTLGNDSMRGHKVKVHEEGGAIHANLWMPGTTAPIYSPLFGQLCDQWTNMIWMAPSCMRLDYGVVPPGEPAVQKPEDVAVHILTPETNRTTHYFYGTCGVFGTEQRDLAEMIRAAQTAAFVDEDNPMIEAVDENMGGADLWSLRPAILGSDVASVRVRRAIEKMIRRESISPAEDEAPTEAVVA
jgi:phenylpropionate dioxygenase-like ring-hydroxylating dioxygenase large terminal subunit